MSSFNEHSKFNRSFNVGYKKGMAGPQRQFDKYEALETCMQTFWEKGYQSTSYEDLVKATGVHRASIYSAFGSKAELFEQALQMYVDRNLAYLLDTVRGQSSPLAGIEAGLRMMQTKARTMSHQGCFCGNAGTELSNDHPGVAKIVRIFYQRFQDIFRLAFQDAIRKKELPTDFNASRWSLLLLTLAQGGSNLSQAGADPQEMIDMLEGVIEELKAKNLKKK